MPLIYGCALTYYCWCCLSCLLSQKHFCAQTSTHNWEMASWTSDPCVALLHRIQQPKLYIPSTINTWWKLTQPDGTLFFLIFTYLTGRSHWNSRDYGSNVASWTSDPCVALLHTVVCIKDGKASFLRFWKNHP